jgi:predicted unusual protein kinase regulating ubiquinone biosynthesis (AarF/ABC1/UbiB family)
MFRNICLFFNINFYLLCYLFNFYSYNETIKNIFEALMKVNHFYSKFFQWQFQNNFLDKELTDYFKKCLDNVHYDENDIDYNTLDNIKKFSFQNNDNLIIDYKPFKSGTIALVFKAKLNKQDVVIKIIRNNIENKIKYAIQNYIFVSKLFIKVYFIIYGKKMIDFDNIIKNNEDFLLQQCDFMNEAKNIEIFSKFESNKKFNILIPKVYKEYTNFSNKVLIMEYFQGKSLTELTGEEKIYYFVNFMAFMFDSFIINNFLHGDLHEGNVIFIKKEDKYYIGLIDFGLIKMLNENECNNFFMIFINIINKNTKQTIKILLKILDIHIEKSEINNIVKIAKENNLFQKDFDVNDLEFIIKIINKYLINNNINVNKESSITLLIMISYISMHTKLKEINCPKDSCIFNNFLKSYNLTCV